MKRSPFPFSGYRGFAADIHLPENPQSIDFIDRAGAGGSSSRGPGRDSS